MKAQFIYSVAALATFPIVVNAQTNAVEFEKITALKNGTTFSSEPSTLVKGKYTFKSVVVPTGATGKKAQIQICDGSTVIVSDEVKVGDPISIDFELTTKSEAIIVKVTSEEASADFVINESLIQLNFNFSKVAELLQIEYNKVTNALAAAEYTGKASDAQKYSAYYDRILAIANADYAFYAKDDEKLQTIYADQTKVTGLTLYSDIQDALVKVLANEKTYQLGLLDGNDGLAGLNARYDLLNDGIVGPNYITDALTAKKTAATVARNAYNEDASGANLTAAKNALKAYKDELEKEEAVKKANEDAKKNLDAALAGVYGSTTSYYAEALKQIAEQYTARYTDLKNELTAELAAIVGGNDYTSVAEAIVAAYNTKTANAKLTELGVKISEFKQKLTQKVSDFNTVKDQLAEVYVSYDAEDKAANELVKDAAGFLVTDGYKKAVLDAVADFLTLIEANDQFATVKNLTAEAIKAKTDAIAAAKATYSAKAAIYADYKALKAAVAAETASLNSVNEAIDKDAKDTKKLDDGVFKPTVIWKTTIWAIEGQISGLNGQVDAHESTATAFKTDKGYTEPLAAIKKAIADLQTNALAATALYADIAGKLKAAKDLREALIDPTKDPKVDLTALNVWSNQVTIDETMKARTPYKAFIADGDGSITVAIANLATELDAAPGKTEKLNDKADNTTNILPYLKSLSADTKKVTDGTDLMNLIKANYSADEAKFAQQKDIEEANGIRTLITGKAEVFEPMIAALQKRINNKEFGVVKGAKLQEEIDAITAKINAAKTLAADATATKAQLSAEYEKIKDLDTKDIATAEGHATTYASDFTEFTNRYKNLNGPDDDSADHNTVNGLNAFVKAEKEKIKALGKLTDAQKNAHYALVDAIAFETVENEVKVTYTLASIKTFIETAWQKEELTEAEVSKYQTIIGVLKLAAAAVTIQATRLNGLEVQLATINLEQAAKDVLKKDKNTNGYFYLLLMGNTKAGQYTFDFNKLKGDIEADADITDAEVISYGEKITTLKDKVDGVAAKAEANLQAFEAAKKAYDFTPAATSTETPGAIQRYAVAKAKLEKYPSSQLQNQLTTIGTMKDALDQLHTKAEQNYNEGKAVADDATNITNKIKEIENKVDEFTNPVNYNAQIAADNKAMYEAIAAARVDADAAYATASAIINTYKNFQSDELKAAANSADAELQALLTYLASYDAKVKAVKDASDDAYAAVVSPDVFDKDGSYKKQYEDITAELQAKTKALSDKINEFAAVNVSASVTNYTAAIKASKDKVVKFSSNDKDLAPAVLNGIFSGIDDMLKAITDVQDDPAKIKTLDGALVDAAKAGDGIKDQITLKEQNQAISALQTIIAANTNSGLLTGNDKKSFDNIKSRVNSAAAATKITNSDRKSCVSNFTSWKNTLNDLKAKADQIAKDNATIAATVNAIQNAETVVSELSLDYINYAAGSQVKAAVEQIVEDLMQYDDEKVTIQNAAAWKTAVEAIVANVTTVYGNLYDAEVTAIEGLIAKAKEENLTYAGADKATIANNITAEENKLKAVKEAVALASDKPGYKSKKTALQGDLKFIEKALNGYIKTMTDANETNLNGVIVENLNAQVDAQQKALNKSLDVLKNYTVPATLTATKAEIQDAIDGLKGYITTHADEMASYQANAEAMLADITAAIEQLKADAQAEKVKQDEKAAADALAALNQTWKDAQQEIDWASEDIDRMTGQLGYYGSASNYANKVNKLNEQLAAAIEILDAAKAEAEGKETTAEKQKVANKALTDVQTALTSLGINCNQIIYMASQAYINAFIDKLEAQVIADTWSASDNYTWTDKSVLTGMRDALIQSIDDLKNAANNVWYHAEDYKNNKGIVTEKGVLTILSEGETQFNKDLAELKQALKDMALVEDVKGHISGNDDISTDDLEDLADIILNAEEEGADMARCDINGDDQVDVTDLVWLRYFLVHGDWPAVAAAARGEMANDYIDMQIVSTANNVTRVAVNLNNETVFNHFQLNVQLPEGAKVVGQSLGERVEGANLMMAQNGGTVRLLAVSTANNVFAGNEGAVVYIDIENLNGEVNIEKAIFTDTELTGHELTANSTTGITETITNALESAGQKIYNLGGKMMNGLKKGINIIRNADGSTTKVMK